MNTFVAQSLTCGERSQSTSGPLKEAAASIRHVWRVLVATLREIFDENAYERFLSTTHTSRSKASYRSFLLERESFMARRSRCC